MRDTQILQPMHSADVLDPPLGNLRRQERIGDAGRAAPITSHWPERRAVTMSSGS